MDASLATTMARLSGPPTHGTVKPPAAGDTLKTARTAAQEFEAVFLTTMLEGMFAGLKTDPPFGGGSSEKTYRSLLVGEYAKQISQNGGLGISEQITRDLIALQEGAQR